MLIALVVILSLSSIALIAIVLLQSGRSAGLSGAITGGGGEAVFGKKKGMEEVMGKVTAVLAGVFLLSCLGIAMLTK